jgi:HKD family nuclease
MNATQKAQLAQETLQASRLKRDTEQKLAYDKEQNDLQVEQYKRQMDLQIQTQKNNIDSTANNLAMSAGVS